MEGLVDVIRLSPEQETLSWLEKFQAQLQSPVKHALPDKECNGYWQRVAGMQLC
jgi:hypothetical protein